MDPEEWQRLADEIASESTAALDQIEQEFWPEPSDPSFRTFWPRIRELSDTLQTAPAIDIEVKLFLLGRIRQLTKRARQDQEVYFTEQRHRKQETLDAVQELRSKAVSSRSPEEIRRLRQELNDMREIVTTLELPARGDRQEVWQTWQSAAQEVWKHLNAIWEANEARLTELLNQAQNRLDRGNIREARDLVRSFNTESRQIEVSHKTARSLRNQANTLWREAEEVGRVKHETFVQEAPQKVERWKGVQGKNARAIAALRAEISDLERAGSGSDVGAALVKALVEDKLRELERLETTNASLEDRIENTEAALTSVN